MPGMFRSVISKSTLTPELNFRSVSWCWRIFDCVASLAQMLDTLKRMVAESSTKMIVLIGQFPPQQAAMLSNTGGFVHPWKPQEIAETTEAKQRESRAINVRRQGPFTGAAGRFGRVEIRGV